MSQFFDSLTRFREAVAQRVDRSFPTEDSSLPKSELESPVRWGRRALWIGIVLFLAWAALAPLSQGVPAHGFIKVEGNRKTIQHLRGGVVEEILVREGDAVETNQPLIRLNEVQVQAQQGVVDSQLVSLLAVEARLKAERAEKNKIVQPEFLTSRQTDPRVMEAISVQRQLFQTRRSGLEGEVAILNESISGLEEQIRGIQAQEQSKAEQLKLFKEELASLKPMYEQGFVPRNRMFELERAIAYLVGQRSEDLSNIGRIKAQIAELRLKALNVRTLARKEVETQLTDVQRQIADLKERRAATQDDLERIVLRSPVAGTVVDLSVHTVGGVISPGQKLMDIVPSDSALIVEVQIPPHLIDNVRTGQEADIHFIALEQTIVPTVPGKLVYVSADRVTDPRTDFSYFVGRVQASEEGMKRLANHTLQPGMPADAVIKTGERTLLGYLVKPFLARLRFAFTER